MNDEEFYALPIAQQIEVFIKQNNLDQSAEKKYKKFMKNVKKNKIKLGETVSYKLPEKKNEN